jgi:hypothetical protein
VTKTTLRDAARLQTEEHTEKRDGSGSLGAACAASVTLLLFRGATVRLPFSSPRLGRTATSSLAWGAGAGACICGGIPERIRLRAGNHYLLS